MFTEKDILHRTNAKVMERGRVILRNADAISERTFSRMGDACELSARIASASGIRDAFHTTIITDRDGDAIEGYECDCPAAARSRQMCKHGVALGLDVLAEPEAYSGFGLPDEVQTSRSITAFLERTAEKGPTSLGVPVSLALTLTHDFGAWSASFRLVGQQGSYVISDISSFAAAVMSESTVSYGKRLGFTHRLDNFEPGSRELVKHIVGIVQERMGGRVQRPSLGAGSAAQERPAIRRSLALTEREAAALLASIGTSDFSFEDKATGTALYNLSIVDADPLFSLRILREEGGYSIMRDNVILTLSNGEHLFAFQDGIWYRTSTPFARTARFIREVYESDDADLFISNEDAPAFCARVLPLLEGAFPLSIPPELELLKPREGRLSFYFDKEGAGEKGVITLTIRVSYGEASFLLLGPDDPSLREVSEKDAEEAEGLVLDAKPISPLEASYRDDDLEGGAMDLAEEYFDGSMRLPLTQVESAGELLYGGLERFRNSGEVFTTPAFDRLIADKRTRMQMGLSIAGDLIQMDVSATDLDKEELVALLKSYRRKKRFHRLKDGVIASLQDLDLREFDGLLSDLGLVPEDLLSDRVELPTYRAYLLDREYASAYRDASFDAYVDKLDTPPSDPPDPPLTLNAVMRPYQIDGFRWLSRLTDLGFGGILADEMGLGKSLQLIALLLERKGENALSSPALIVCPASLVYNWMDEFAKFAPSLRVVPIEGSKRERIRAWQTHADVLIASYDMVRMDIDELGEGEFSFIVLDEAQYIKNHATKTARAIKRLKGAHRFALTGTPIENRLSEAWSLFDFLMPGFLGSYESFRKRYEIDILGGDAEATGRLRALIAPFVLRRLKESVLTELPAKQESIVHVQMNEAQRKLYDANEQALREDLNLQKREKGTMKGFLKVDVLAELMRLRQIALDPALVYENAHEGGAKTAAIMELIAQAMESGEKTLVFSQFTSYLSILERELDARSIPYHVITGQTPKKRRIELVGSFNEDDTPVFLVSLKAGGTGLNLIGASNVIHADPWWNAAAIDQATDRAHRIGQKEMVSVYKIIAKGTIEERIQRLQEKKAQLADSVIGETSSGTLADLTKEELQELLFD